MPIIIDKDSLVSEIVKKDYRTASVFNKYDIDFCCNGKWRLGFVCEMQGLDYTAVKNELEKSIRIIQVPGSTRFADWNIDFLTEYIVNVHHQYLKDILPQIRDQFKRFLTGHQNEYRELEEVQQIFNSLLKDIYPHLQQEEEILFPYIRQIAHAYDSKESYASLLVRTLRKPVAEVMQHEHESISTVLEALRAHTNNYTPPEHTNMNYHVAYSMLKELDHDLVQHVFLENDILFPRAIAMEKELTRSE
ncbi:MAG: hypothetical protein B6D37_03350 [Sphingobacteriales bacterium UTBCD1]|jgi:regulator of cell morphogenesis and NO signaling|nr:MAG: hypothetical protein B6D37_03350 [Sphingobacteriales bacterium UTBCD1]